MFDLKKIQMLQQQIQDEMASTKKDLATKTVEGTAGGGAVTVVVNGNQEIVSLKIKPEAVDPDDLEMLEDLMMAAVNAGLDKSKELQQKAMSGVAGGMLPPGFQMPF